MQLCDLISNGGLLWILDDPRSPGHDIALPSGTCFKVRTGGAQSEMFVDGHVEDGCWLLDSGEHAGRYQTANATVQTVHEGTSLDAWLYVVIRHQSVWLSADDVRRLPNTELDSQQVSRLKWCERLIRKRPEAKGLPRNKILIAAARKAARMDNE